MFSIEARLRLAILECMRESTAPTRKLTIRASVEPRSIPTRPLKTRPQHVEGSSHHDNVDLTTLLDDSGESFSV